MTNLLINVHGFLSSHESDKINRFRKCIEDDFKSIDFISPKLPDNPEPAVELIEEIIEERRNHYDAIGLVGHSLGGYFSTYIASRYNIKATLVNPVVRGYEIMCEFFGKCYNPYTNESFEIKEQDIEFLISINMESIPDKSLFLVMQQMGDEILDPEDALAYYKGCATILEEGGNHEFVEFSNYAKSIIKFLYGMAA